MTERNHTRILATSAASNLLKQFKSDMKYLHVPHEFWLNLLIFGI